MSKTTYIANDPTSLYNAYCALYDMNIDGTAISALLCDGPPGTGKTFLAKHLSEILKAELLHFQFFKGCDKTDMLWEKDPTSPNGVSEGLLIQAIRSSQTNKTVLILDEIDKAEPSVDAFLLNILNEGFVFIPRIGEIRANRNNLLIVITKNDERDIMPPLARRCRVVYMEWPTLDTEYKIVSQSIGGLTRTQFENIIEIPNRLRGNPEIKKAPSTPEIIRLLCDIIRLKEMGVGKEAIGRYFVNGLLTFQIDRRFIEKSPLFLGIKVYENLEGCSIMKKENEISLEAEELIKNLKIS